MRILVAMVHYFSGEEKPLHSSTNEKRRDERSRAVAAVIHAYRGLYGSVATLDIASRSFVPSHGNDDQIDLALVTMKDCSLLDDAFCARYGINRIDCAPANPRMLGFHAWELFAQLRFQYDLFVFTEDDLRPADPDFFAKLAWFNREHGGSRLLQPNRFEWNPNGPAIKTYVDGDLGNHVVDPLVQRLPDSDTLSGDALGRRIQFRRARNPHSGFFAIDQAQLGHWMRQPHWLDRDCSFVGPLESSATLGVAKTFAIFKPFGSSAGFLELQHLDSRFSGMALPRAGDTVASIAANSRKG